MVGILRHRGHASMAPDRLSFALLSDQTMAEYVTVLCSELVRELRVASDCLFTLYGSLILSSQREANEWVPSFRPLERPERCQSVINECSWNAGEIGQELADSE
jgi:hypothetical protein